ncbi:DUF3124 domain-containing protein [Winogradskyella ursingii]|uniref:DUF3124 domain-containing protein n=1 Tax=Winogradskyella ursingii TaxID=2686079 RepID=UPI0015CD97D9|nr:DUF3124 domain-containing protein [Winogradskyella ursingii]
MKYCVIFFIACLSFNSCENKREEDPIKVDWKKRTVSHTISDSLETGKSYLSIYSQIYSLSQHKKYNLTAMVSLRNTSEKDTIYLLKADYHGTHGEMIKQYINKPVYLLPMETLDIVIEESDVSGGTGSNFIFDWKMSKNAPEPIFEAVMSSTVGSQGLSFTTQGKRID